MENNMSTTKPIVLNLGIFLPKRDDLSRMPLAIEFNLDTGKVIDLKNQIAKVLQLSQEELCMYGIVYNIVIFLLNEYKIVLI